MDLIAVVGLVLCIIYYRRWPHFFKFRLGKSIKFMVAHILLAVILATGAQMAGLSKYEELQISLTKSKIEQKQIEVLIELYDMPTYKIALAGFEDAIFVLPLLPIKNTLILGTGIVTSSVTFTAGHIYQGIPSMLGKSGYVALAYYFASRYGILTTMVAHAVNDVLALYSLKNTLERICNDMPIKKCLNQ